MPFLGAGKTHAGLRTPLSMSKSTSTFLQTSIAMERRAKLPRLSWRQQQHFTPCGSRRCVCSCTLRTSNASIGSHCVLELMLIFSNTFLPFFFNISALLFQVGGGSA